MPKLIPVIVEHEEFFISFSFDIDNFIGDGTWWLQIYDEYKNLIYDESFTTSISEKKMQRIEKIIKDIFLTHKGAVLIL